jgi:hypothetical protein
MANLEFPVSQTFLAHAVLASISPEVTALDRIIALQSKGSLRVESRVERTKTLADVPPELLLIVRSYLVPAVTDALVSETMFAYADSLLSRARRLCGECLKYNVQVYGPDALTWPSSRQGLTEDAQGCACGTWALRADLCIAEGSSRAKLEVSAFKDTLQGKMGNKRGHKRTHSYSTASVAWLEQYLAKRAGRGKPMRDVIREVVAADFGCLVDDGDATSPRCPSSSNAYVPDSVTIVASPSCLPPSAEDQIALVVRELALPQIETTGSELLTAARDMAASVIAEAAAGVPSMPSCPAPKHGVAVAGPSLATLVGAGLALGAYVCSRLLAL